MRKKGDKGSVRGPRVSSHRLRSGGVGYPVEFRLRAAREVVDRGVSAIAVARAFGVGTTTLFGWVAAYRRHGVKGLTPGAKPYPQRPVQADARRDAVIRVKREQPQYGTRRIRDVLKRFEALGISETAVRRILHEEGLIQERPASVERAHPERRFERSEPNQLWQSDIFTFLLRRYERVYIGAFLDDHSRFLVSYAVAHHQKSSLVLEGLRQGVASFGAPREVLTDQGRQYTSWRGQTEFEEELRREGIRHVKSRPQHPQTLGKIERFWKTLWDEFLSRTVFADFEDFGRRLKLYVDAYNFQRPHQGLSGLVPADRFFRSAPQVRAGIEANVARNALRLAQEQPPQKPFYLVGRLGDRDLTIAAERGALHVQVGNEKPERIALGRESEEDERTQASSRVRGGGQAPAAAEPTDAGVVGQREGSGRDGQAPLSDGALGVERVAAGDRGDHRGKDLAGHLLPTGDQSVAGDAPGSSSGQRVDRRRGGYGDAAVADGAEDLASGEGEAAQREAAIPDPSSVEAGAGVFGESAQVEPEAPQLDLSWQEAFDELEGYELESADVGTGCPDRSVGPEHPFSPWDAPLTEGEDGGPEKDLRTDAPGSFGVSRAVSDDPASSLRGALGQYGGSQPFDLAQPFPDSDAPWTEGADRWDRAEAFGPAGSVCPAETDGAAGRTADTREPQAAATSRDHRATAAGRRGVDEGSLGPSIAAPSDQGRQGPGGGR